MSYDALLSPFRLKHLELRNRVMMTAHVTNMAPLHLPTEQHVAYYRDRARGGIGLIVMGFPSVHPAGTNNVQEIAGYDPAIVPGLRAIAEAVHEYGTPIIAQLGHAGRQGNSAYTMRPLMAPSPIPCPLNREMPKAMEAEDLDEVVEGHALAAGHVQAAGLDGVEIHSAYGGYLLSSFLSPYMNEREDEYGGDLDGRMRLPLRVVHAVRDRVGPDYIVGMQINGDDFSPGGIELPEAQVIAQRLIATGALDYLVVKGSTYFVADQNVPDWQHERALWLPLAAGIKEAVGAFPVFAVGRINDPDEANAVIERGQADMVAMTRQHIADPETVRKLVEGRREDVRGCISCNQGCLDMLPKGRHITCVHNPAAGYEAELGIGTLRPADAPRRVVVVGGGPAGMKVAEIAARRGHEVRLLERRDDLGGQVRLAGNVPGREEVREVVRYLETQVRKLGVDVRCGVTATADDEALADADAVVVATGSQPVRRLIGVRSYQLDGVPGLDLPHVLDELGPARGRRRAGRVRGRRRRRRGELEGALDRRAPRAHRPRGADRHAAAVRGRLARALLDRSVHADRLLARHHHAPVLDRAGGDGHDRRAAQGGPAGHARGRGLRRPVRLARAGQRPLLRPAGARRGRHARGGRRRRAHDPARRARGRARRAGAVTHL